MMGLLQENITLRAENVFMNFFHIMKPILTLKIKFFKVLAKSIFIFALENK